VASERDDFHEMVRRHYLYGEALEEAPEIPEDDLTDDEVDRRYAGWRRMVERYRRPRLT
jgi:hypothetical protein